MSDHTNSLDPQLSRDPPEATAVKSIMVFFNFRSPYCYLASKRMFRLIDNFNTEFDWKPLAGWNGRSDPARAKIKLPIARQDVARFAHRMGIPMVPPPISTDPTLAALASLAAQSKGSLRPWVIEVMRAEWAYGLDIGDKSVLLKVAEQIGLDLADVQQAWTKPKYAQQLKKNWKQAQSLGAFGVPTFVIDDQIFWGQDRIEFVEDHLRELRLARL